jgi:indolepyruvate ferredoxin oxidoreductase beta subunit
VLLGQAEYPKGLADKIKEKFSDTLLVDGQGLALKAGDVRAANTVLLGAVSKRLSIAEDVWQTALEKMVPKKALEINRQAFVLGRSL